MSLLLEYNERLKRVRQGTNTSIPLKSDALFWLDGTISGNTFVDKSGNNRNFTITGKDFVSNWTKGFPYKSTATISAPVGDATLIAADVNNFLYTAGTPNQIPVVSFFQDIDYVHKLFCRHASQIVDANGVETYEARVMEIVLYVNAKTGADLTTCQTYYSVTTEVVTAVRWIDPINGNNTTGTGSKIAPWKSLDKARTAGVDNETVYMRSGEDAYALNPFYPTKLQDFIATGRFLISGTTGTQLISTYVAKTWQGLQMSCAKTYVFLFASAATGNLRINRCKIDSTGGYLSAINSLTGNVYLTNCVIPHPTTLFAFNPQNTTEILNNYIENFNCTVTKVGTSLKINNNKIKVSITAPANALFTNTRSTFQFIGNIVNSIATNGFSAFRTLPDGTDQMDNGKVNYNYLATALQSGFIVNLGNEAAYVNIHDNTEIIGNRMIGGYLAAPSVEGSLHGLIAGCGINNIIKYNFISHCRFGLVVKTGTQQAYTSGGVSYNLLRNNVDGIYFRGVGGAKCYNNTIINDVAISAREFLACVNCDENSVLPGNYSENIIIRNNIMICTAPTSVLIKLDVHAAANGCTSDYNIFYSTKAKPFIIGNAGNEKTWVEWQALGYDTHSIMLTTLDQVRALFTDFDNGDFTLKSGSQAIGSGVDLGVNYNTGLAASTSFGSSEKVPVIATKQQSASWDIGAYIH